MDYQEDDSQYDEIPVEALATDLGGEIDSKWLASRKQGGGERRNAGHLWLISYADFMTILMIFYLAMYGYTVINKAKLVAESAPLQTLSEFAEEIQDLKTKLGDKVQITKGVGKVTLQLSDDVLFDSGQASPHTEALNVLAGLATSLKRTEGTIIVQGHTDDVPIKGGSYPSNWELSAARSINVIDALSKNGVPSERLSAWGFGENRPLSPNTSSENRAKNRRIEVVILNPIETKGAK